MIKSYKISLDRDWYSKHREIFKWCEEQFGEYLFTNEESITELNDRWDVTLTFGYQNYIFAREEDAVLFTLKWVE